MSNKVNCAKHGEQDRCFVCQHLVTSLDDLQVRGINWLRDPEGDVNAWCDACEERIVAEGGEWTETTNEFAQIKLICGGCYDVLTLFNPINDLN